MGTPRRSAELPAAARPRVALVTAGIDAVSGGHRYHRQLMAAAHSAGFDMQTVRPRPRLRLPAGDVVVVDSLFAWTLACAMLRRGAPSVALVHQHPGGVDGAGPTRWLRRRLDLAVYRRCDLVIAPGRAVADSLIGEHGFQPTRIEVVRPGCDLPAAAPAPPLRGARALGLLNVANWLPNKGILELLEAVALLPAASATLHLVGRTDADPRYARLVRERIARPDLADRVVVHGALPAAAVSSLYGSADVFVFPSRVEAYGSAVGEALAAGVPVVGWDTPHLRALIADGAEGLLVPADDTRALAAAIGRLATDRAQLDRLASGAVRLGAQLPTWHATTDHFFAIVHRLLAGSPGARPPSATRRQA